MEKSNVKEWIWAESIDSFATGTLAVWILAYMHPSDRLHKSDVKLVETVFHFR